MSASFIAFHYPHAEHFEDFVARTYQVRDALEAAEGCESAEVWATTDGDAVVTIARFETPEAHQRAVAAARELPAVVFDDRESRARQVYTLVSR